LEEELPLKTTYFEVSLASVMNNKDENNNKW
jgi:hypothetical protein